MKKFILVTLLFLFQVVEAETSYDHQLSALLIFQDEAPYLKEWIEFHKMVGVEHFYLIDNGSIDDYQPILAPYIENGELELDYAPKRATNAPELIALQRKVYDHYIKKLKEKTKWLAIIDTDEFLVPLNGGSLLSYLKPYEQKKVGGILLNYLLFGTSNVEKLSPNQLIIESLTRSDKKLDPIGKSILRPKYTIKINTPHRMKYVKGYKEALPKYDASNALKNIGKSNILLHHYYTRDLDHLKKVKFQRRALWIKNLSIEEYVKSLEHLNSIEFPIMQNYIPELRQRVKL